jgi:hypothetical protein
MFNSAVAMIPHPDKVCIFLLLQLTVSVNWSYLFLGHSGNGFGFRVPDASSFGLVFFQSLLEKNVLPMFLIFTYFIDWKNLTNACLKVIQHGILIESKETTLPLLLCVNLKLSYI